MPVLSDCCKPIWMKRENTTKPAKVRDLLAERYGAPGSGSREAFRETAFAMYFGEIIRQRRRELGLSQEELAVKIGKKRPYISRIEKGEDIRLSNFALVANALGLSIRLMVADSP